jgi:hypothetical protein
MARTGRPVIPGKFTILTFIPLKLDVLHGNASVLASCRSWDWALTITVVMLLSGAIAVMITAPHHNALLYYKPGPLPVRRRSKLRCRACGWGIGVSPLLSRLTKGR